MKNIHITQPIENIYKKPEDKIYFVGCSSGKNLHTNFRQGEGKLICNYCEQDFTEEAVNHGLLTNT